MVFVAPNPERFAGRAVGSGHCVPLIQVAAGAPHTSHWRRGPRVRGSGAARGTAIATFGGEPPRYQNRTDGSSHAAILIREQSDGLQVWDQWVGRRTAQRIIRFRNGVGTANNDGDRFFIIVRAITGTMPLAGAARATLRRNSQGEEVRALQRLLGVNVTGVFGPQTEASVREFQTANNLLVDGIVGPQTWGALARVREA